MQDRTTDGPGRERLPRLVIARYSGSMVFRPSRRAVLAALAANAVAAEQPLVVRSEARRFRDPATEFELTRLTDPAVASCWLPLPHLRSLGSRGNWLIYPSDRSGSVQLYRMQTESGDSVQLTNARGVHPEMSCATADGRTLIFFADRNLTVQSGRRSRSVYSSPAEWKPAPPFAATPDGQFASFVEEAGGRFRVRVVALRRGAVNTLIEGSMPVSLLRFRPGKVALLYGTEEGLTVVDTDGRHSTRLKLPEGKAGDAQWSADGRVVHYLHRVPLERGVRVSLRDHHIETAEDKLVGITTQFLSFARNGDSSVFAGVSGSVGAPYLLLLVRSGRRELTIAEHRASEGSKAVVAFSPDSQRIYFQTDRQGRPAIHVMALERFVEKTDEIA